MTPLEATTNLITLVIAIIALISAVTVAYFTFRGGKFAVMQAQRASKETRADVWNAGYRAAAEPHLFWDVKIIAVVAELQAEVRDLRAAAHLPPKEFEPIPDPPPLFPKLDAVKS